MRLGCGTSIYLYIMYTRGIMGLVFFVLVTGLNGQGYKVNMICFKEAQLPFPKLLPLLPRARRLLIELPQPPIDFPIAYSSPSPAR